MTDKQKDLFTTVTWLKGDPIVIDDQQGRFCLIQNDKFMVEFDDLEQGGTYKRLYPIEDLPKKNVPTPPKQEQEIEVGQIRACRPDSDVPYIKITDDYLVQWGVTIVTIIANQNTTMTDDEINTTWFRLLDEEPTVVKLIPPTVPQPESVDEDPEKEEQPSAQIEVTLTTGPGNGTLIDGSFPPIPIPEITEDDEDNQPTPPEEEELPVGDKITADDIASWKAFLAKEDAPSQLVNIQEWFVVQDASGDHQDDANKKLVEKQLAGWTLQATESKVTFVPSMGHGQSYVNILVCWTFKGPAKLLA